MIATVCYLLYILFSFQLRNFKSSIADVGTAGFAFDQAMEKTFINVAWRTDNEQKISNWLKEKTGLEIISLDSQ